MDTEINWGQREQGTCPRSQVSWGKRRVQNPGFRFLASLPSQVPDQGPRPRKVDPDPSQQGLGIWPHLRPGKEGRGRPDSWRMLGKQGTDAPTRGVAKLGGGASAGLREDPRRLERSALPRWLLGPSPTHLRSEPKAGGGGAAGAAANPGFSHSPLPRMGRDGGRSLP